MIIDEFETEDAFEDEITKYDYLMGQMADHHGDCPYGFFQVNPLILLSQKVFLEL